MDLPEALSAVNHIYIRDDIHEAKIEAIRAENTKLKTQLNEACEWRDIWKALKVAADEEIATLHKEKSLLAERIRTQPIPIWTKEMLQEVDEDATMILGKMQEVK